jgi:hypothetical protein
MTLPALTITLTGGQLVGLGIILGSAFYLSKRFPRGSAGPFGAGILAQAFYVLLSAVAALIGLVIMVWFRR